MVLLQPKVHFQGNEKIKAEMATIATSGNFQTVLSFALAEFVMRTTPNAEQISAVRAFIVVLLNLSQREEPLPFIQEKQLDHSVCLPTQPPQHIPPKK